MRTIFFVLFSLFFLHISAQKTTIKGTLINHDDMYKEITLENVLTETELTTVKIKKNKFSFETEAIEETDFYKLELDDNNYILLVVVPGESIEIKADLNDLFSPTVKGSQSSALIYDTYNELEKYEEEKDSLIAKVESKREEYLVKIVTENTDKLSVLFFLDQLDESKYMELYKKVSEELNEKYPDNILVQDLQGSTTNMQSIEVGSEAPEINLPTPDGENIKLSSLRGKVVLIDFWASWCGPCIREIPTLVELYKTYKTEGFEIYGVSLDANKEGWTGAIKEHDMKWIHVSDLKYWQSEAAGTYNVEGIPHTVLIDKNGIIIAKDLRGEELKEKLKEIF